MLQTFHSNFSPQMSHTRWHSKVILPGRHSHFRWHGPTPYFTSHCVSLDCTLASFSIVSFPHHMIPHARLGHAEGWQLYSRAQPVLASLFMNTAPARIAAVVEYVGQIFLEHCLQQRFEAVSGRHKNMNHLAILSSLYSVRCLAGGILPVKRRFSLLSSS